MCLDLAGSLDYVNGKYYYGCVYPHEQPLQRSKPGTIDHSPGNGQVSCL